MSLWMFSVYKTALSIKLSVLSQFMTSCILKKLKNEITVFIGPVFHITRVNKSTHCSNRPDKEKATFLPLLQQYPRFIMSLADISPC